MWKYELIVWLYEGGQTTWARYETMDFDLIGRDIDELEESPNVERWVLKNNLGKTFAASD